jgi:hypothetical protein
MNLGHRAWLIIPWLLFIGIVIGWIAYWNILAAQTEQRVAAFVSQQNAQGAHVSYARLVRHGFPVLLRLEIDGVSYADGRGGWRLQTAQADLNVEMLNPQHVILQAKAPIAVSRADGAATNVTAQSLLASLRTENGALAVAGIEADNLTLDDPAQPGELTIRKLVINVRPDPRRGGDYQLALEADDLHLPRPVRSFESLGQDAPLLRAAIVAEQGAALLHAAPGDPLGPWRAAGGRLRFEALDLHWGALDLTGEGEGTLDAQRRLAGSLTLRVHHPAPLLNAIADAPTVSHETQRVLRALATGFALTGGHTTLHASAANGELSLEGAEVRPLPAVY